MFERFTPQARAAVTGAVGEAERRRDRHVGTEHLLLSVFATDDPLVRAALDAAGVDGQRAREVMDAGDLDALAAVGVDVRTLPAPEPDPPRRLFVRRRRSPGHLPFTGGAKRALEATLRQALRRGDRHIGTEHLVLTLTECSPRDPAQHLLTALDVDVPALRADLERRLSDAA